MPDIDIGELSEVINDKMDRDLNNRTDGSGLRKLVESYANGTSWYKVFDEIQENGTIRKWCEQGGTWGTSTGDWASASVVFLKPFIDTNFHLIALGNWSSGGSSSCSITARSTTGFTGTYANNLYSVMPSFWRAYGYIS